MVLSWPGSPEGHSGVAEALSAGCCWEREMLRGRHYCVAGMMSASLRGAMCAASCKHALCLCYKQCVCVYFVQSSILSSKTCKCIFERA